MLDLSTYSDEQLASLITEAAAILDARSKPLSKTRHSYDFRGYLNKDGKFLYRFVRLTAINGQVVSIPLEVKQIGKTGKVMGGEFELPDGDVVIKIRLNPDGAEATREYYLVWHGYEADDLESYDPFCGKSAAEVLCLMRELVSGKREHARSYAEDSLRIWGESSDRAEAESPKDLLWISYKVARVEESRDLLRWIEESEEERKAARKVSDGRTDPTEAATDGEVAGGRGDVDPRPDSKEATHSSLSGETYV